MTERVHQQCVLHQGLGLLESEKWIDSTGAGMKGTASINS